MPGEVDPADLLRAVQELASVEPHTDPDARYTREEWPTYCEGYYTGLVAALRVMEAETARSTIRTPLTLVPPTGARSNAHPWSRSDCAALHLARTGGSRPRRARGPRPKGELMPETPTSAPPLAVRHLTCSELPNDLRAPSFELVKVLKASHLHTVVLKCPACHTMVVLQSTAARFVDQLVAQLTRAKP